VFPDGSKEMLSGCPDCGGNTFQFRPEGAPSAEDRPNGESPPEPPGPDSTVTETVSKATRTVRDWVTDRTPPEGDRRSDPGEEDDPGSGPDTGSDPVSGSDSGPLPETGGSGAEPPPDDPPPGGPDDPPDLGGTDDGAYPAWPNPDDADTSGVGKGPSARREREAEASDRSGGDHAGQAPSTDPADGGADQARGASSADEFEWTDEPAGGSTADPSFDPDGEPVWDSDHIRARTEEHEDDAQATARSDMVTPDELPGPTGIGGAGPDSTDETPPTEARPDRPEPRTGDRAATGDDADHQPPSEGPPPTTPPESQPPASVSEPADPPDGRVADSPSSGERPDLAELREELNDQFESIKIVSPGQYELNLMELYDRDEYIISLREDGRYVIEVAESWRGDGE